MGRRIDCTISGFENAFVVLPDEWLGEHLARRDRAIAKHSEMRSAALTEFGVALALAEDWGGIPGLDGNPENWDFEQMSAKIINWFTQIVISDFRTCFEIPKVTSSPSPNGSTVPEAMERQPG